MSNISRFLKLLIFLSAMATGAAAASLICTPAGVAALVRAEGLTEPMGEIVLNCTGGDPGGTLVGTLFVFLSVPVTNRVTANGVADVVLTVENGSTSNSAGAVPTMVGNGGIAFNGINATLSASGAVSFRISNLRGAVAQQGIDTTTPITASLGYNGAMVLLTQASVTVGVPTRTLLAGATAAAINCYGSPVPETITMSGLISAGTRPFTKRITPGFNGAFEKRQPGADSGIRFVLGYSGLPAGARLFAPDVVAGSDATQPTAGGDLGVSASGGAYTPGGNGSLLLARVSGADANGAGGGPVYIPGAAGSGTVQFDGAAEIPLVSGAGQVVYEVVDANPLARATAQIPTFLALAATSSQPSGGTQTVSLAPVSTVARASEDAPVPRFVAALPAPDCPILGDCASFPKLEVVAPPLEFTAQSGSRDVGGLFAVGNSGGGVLAWTVSVAYETSANWITLAQDPWGYVWVTVSPRNLAPGVYKATLIIDAGAYAGSQTLPVKLTVTAPAPVLHIDSIGNAATYAVGALAPGSLAMLIGTKLAGTSVKVSFDSLPAKLLYTSDTQINLQVPPELGSRASAQAVVTVDGVVSAPFTVSLTAIGPGIFPSGILNQDSSLNSASNPAAAGSVVAVFATGLAGAGVITAKIHDREIGAPDYAGPAPTLIGVEQVNIRIPADLLPMTTDVVVCGLDPSTGRSVCSPPAKITLRQ